MARLKHPRMPKGDFWRDFWNSVRAKNKFDSASPEHLYSQQAMMWNIYSPGATVGEHCKRWNWVHYFFKYKLFVPFLLVIERTVARKLQTTVPKDVHNKNLIIFNDSFERSIDEWGWLFLRNIGRNQAVKQDEKMWKNYKRNGGGRLLRVMKDSVLTVAQQDTAYREFLNIWMHNMAQDMIREYGGKHVAHLFYTREDIYDVHYYYTWKLFDEGKIQIVIGDANEK